MWALPLLRHIRLGDLALLLAHQESISVRTSASGGCGADIGGDCIAMRNLVTMDCEGITGTRCKAEDIMEREA